MGLVPAVVIGSYNLPQFVHLNISACLRLWPEAEILVSDDRSPTSGEIERIASEYGCAYVCSARRRSHCSGDAQAFINGAVFAEGWVLKISQRFIPLEGFQQRLDELDLKAAAYLPSQLARNQVVRNGAKFRRGVERYLAFGHLCDAVLFDSRVITGDVLRQAHDAGFIASDSSVGMRKWYSLYSEIMWGRLFERFKIEKLGWMANHEPLARKLFLRKACATSAEYARVAGELGLEYDLGSWPVGEWDAMEGRSYRCVPKPA